MVHINQNPSDPHQPNSFDGDSSRTTTTPTSRHYSSSIASWSDYGQSYGYDDGDRSVSLSVGSSSDDPQQKRAKSDAMYSDNPKVAEREGRFQYMAKTAVSVVLVLAVVLSVSILYVMITDNERSDFETQVREPIGLIPSSLFVWMERGA